MPRASVPDDVMGEPLTVKPVGTDRPTLVTVPPPPPLPVVPQDQPLAVHTRHLPICAVVGATEPMVDSFRLCRSAFSPPLPSLFLPRAETYCSVQNPNMALIFSMVDTLPLFGVTSTPRWCKP